MRMKILLLVLLFLSTPVFAATYYVDNTCGVNGNGTSVVCGATGPYNDVPTLVTGNTYSFKKGNTYTRTSSIAVPGNVIINAYGSGAKPIFTRTSSPSNAYAIFYITTGSNITIDGLDIRVTGANGIYINPTANISNITVSNNDFTITRNDDSGYTTGIYYPGTSTYTIHDVTVTGNTFTATNFVGHLYSSAVIWLYLQSQTYNWVFTYNTFTNLNEFFGVQFVENTYEDTNLTWPYSVVFDHNTATNCTKPPIDYIGVKYVPGQTYTNSTSYNTFTHIGGVAGCSWWSGCNHDSPNVNAIQLGYVKNMMVERNSIDGVTTSLPDGVGIILDFVSDPAIYQSTGNTVRWNIVKNAVSGIQVWNSSRNMIYGNTVTSNVNGMEVAENSVDNGIYNNVAYGNTYGLYNSYLSTQNNYWRNNIGYGNTVDFEKHATASAPVEDHNCFVTNNISPSGTDVLADPQFVSAGSSNFHLQSTSPARGVGVSVSGITADAEGNVMGLDMGIYQNSYAGVTSCVVSGGVVSGGTFN